jgi:hypothetical protein
MVKSKQRRQPIVNESSASSSESETGDQAIMSRAKELLSALENGLPSGETPDEVAAFLEVHLRSVEDLAPRVGRGGLVIDLSNRLHGYQKLAEEARQRRDVPAPAAAEPDGRQVTLL